MFPHFHLAGFSILLAAAPLFSEQAADDAELPAVVVSSTRLTDVEVSPDRVPSKVTVVTAKEIKSKGARTVQEALQYLGGVTLYDQIGNSFQSAFDMRGFNGQPVPSTSVFVDGTRVNEADFNTINFNLIPIEAIERIEVIPGSSAIFGKNALGGVLNIVTKRGAEKHRATVEAAGGSFDRQRYTASAGGPLGDSLDYFISGARELEDGFRDDDNGRSTRAFGKMGWKFFDSTDVQASYTHVNDSLKQAGSLLEADAIANPEQVRAFGNVSAAELHLGTINARTEFGDSGFSLATNLSYRKNDQESSNVGIFGTFDSEVDQDAFSGVFQLTHEGNMISRHNLFTLGIEISNIHFNTATSFLSNFTGLVTPGNRASTEDIFAIYVQDSYEVHPRLVVTAGGRFDWDGFDFTDHLDRTNDSAKSFKQATPRAGFTFEVIEPLSIYFNYSQGFRVPTENELFAFAGSSNIDLEPVETDSLELGALGHFGDWFEGSLAAFRISASNEILFAVTNQFLFGGNVNFRKTLRQGLELSLLSRYLDWLQPYVNYSYTEATFEADGVLSPGGPVVPGDFLPLVPKHRLGIGMNVIPAEGWIVSLNGVYQSGQFLLNDDGNNNSKMDSYFVLNGKVSYTYDIRYGRLRLFIQANNILDRDYFTFGSLSGGQTFVIPAASVSVLGGIAYEF